MKVRSSKLFRSLETGIILSSILALTILLSIPKGIDLGEFNAIIGSGIAVTFASMYQRRLGPPTIPDAVLNNIWSVLLSFGLLLVMVLSLIHI